MHGQEVGLCHPRRRKSRSTGAFLQDALVLDSRDPDSGRVHSVLERAIGVGVRDQLLAVPTPSSQRDNMREGDDSGRQPIIGRVQARRSSSNDRDARRFTRQASDGEHPSGARAARARRTSRSTAQDARPSFGALLFNFLPYFLLIGFWIFLFRADAGGRREGVLVRQVEGEAAHGRHAEGHVRRCRRAPTRRRSSCRRSSSS